MAGTKDLLKIMQQAAQGANEASVPCNVVYGKVTSISPLAIKVKEGLIIPASCLTLTRNVTDYTTNVTVNWQTDSTDNHTHGVVGGKSITIHNALAVGDSVAMIKLQGGQSYLVLDRMVS